MSGLVVTHVPTYPMCVTTYPFLSDLTRHAPELPEIMEAAAKRVLEVNGSLREVANE